MKDNAQKDITTMDLLLSNLAKCKIYFTRNIDMLSATYLIACVGTLLV